jgi:hypothetical protein
LLVRCRSDRRSRSRRGRTAAGRQADSARRRQRVVTALNAARAGGTELSVSAVARAAGVDRTFLYRHPDLLALVHTAQSTPLPTKTGAAPVTTASLRADLANGAR